MSNNAKNAQSCAFMGKMCQCFSEGRLLNVLVVSLSLLCILLAVIALCLTIISLFTVSSITALGVGAITALPWLVVGLSALLFVRRYVAK